MDQKGENSVPLALTLELLNIVKTHSGPLDQSNAYWIITKLLTHPEIQKEFVERYGEEEYKRQFEHFSKTNRERAIERKLKEEARRIREEAELKIKELNAQSVAKNADVAQQKLDQKLDSDPEVIKLRRRLEELRTTIVNANLQPETLDRLRKEEQQILDQLAAKGIAIA